MAEDPSLRAWAGSAATASDLDADTAVLSQLGFEGLRRGDKVDDAAGVRAILNC